MKTILIPIDFSTHSINAVSYAASLAEAVNAKLLLLHAYHVPVSYTEVPVAIQSANEIEIETEAELKRIIKQLQKPTSKPVTIEYINREGLLTDILEEVVHQQAIDLIVMGTQGADGLEEILIGSNTAYVVEKVECPVLVVPAHASYKKIKKIMYATDFQFDDFACINQVGEIAASYQAEVFITHVSTNPKNKEEEEDLMDWFIEIADTNVTYPNVAYKTYTGENVLDKLNEAVKELAVDMLCMSTVRRTFFEKLYKSSLTKKMAYHTQIPLLAFHIKESNRL